MAYRVAWSPKAVEDAETIATYIARDSPSYAAAVVQKILDVTRELQDCPLTGEVIAESRDSHLRERLAYTYRIIYHIEETQVTIAAIVHTKGLLGVNS